MARRGTRCSAVRSGLPCCSALRALPRSEVAALIAAAGPALGIGDPVKAIEAFDAMTGDQVEAARTELALPAAYRHARRLIGHHG